LSSAKLRCSLCHLAGQALLLGAVLGAGGQQKVSQRELRAGQNAIEGRQCGAHFLAMRMRFGSKCASTRLGFGLIHALLHRA